MSEWKECKLEDLGYTYSGLSNKSAKDFGTGKPFIPFINILNNSKIDPKNLAYVNILPGERQNFVKTGDLFFTTSSETAEEVGMTSALIDDLGEAYLNSFCFGFRLHNFDDLIPGFACYLFRGDSVRKQIVNLAQGYTRYNLPKRELLKRLILYLPSINEQKRIAEILSTCDAVIEKTKEAIVKYKAIKQGMLHDLFTRGIDVNTGKLRLKFEDAPELYKESALGMVPREWEVERLENLCSLITDGSHFSPKPMDDGKIIVNVKDMGEFGITYDTCTRISLKDFENLSKQNCSPNKGDILLSKDGTVGRVILFNDDLKVVLLSSIAIIRPSEKLLSEFLYTFLKSEYFDKQLLIKMSGSALKRIVLRDIDNLMVAFPTNNDEQSQIANKIIEIEQKLKVEESYLTKLQMLKSGLMGDLLSGRVRVDA